MALTFTVASFCLGYLVICLSGHQVTASLEINRGQHDTFQNLRCRTSQSCKRDHCQAYSAECADNKCERCRCSKNGRNTFVTSGANTGNCTKDESVILESRCETFADGSSIVIVDESKFDKENSEKEIDLRKTRCSLLPNKLQYLHNDTWKKLKSKNMSVAMAVNTKVLLQWNVKKTPKSWRGLLVKVQFKCEETNGSSIFETKHCVLIKYTGTFKGFKNNKEDEKTSLQKLEDPTYDSAGNIKETDPKSKQEINNNYISNKRRNNRKINKTIVIVVWVCDFVLFCIAAVIGIVSHKCRPRFAHLENLGTENTGQNQAPVSLPLNESEPSTSNQPTLEDSQEYEIPNQPVYESVDDIAFTLPQPVNHDNSSGDGSLKDSRKESMELEETGDYVIQPDTGEGDAYDEDYVIKNQDTEERDTYVPPQNLQYELPTSSLYEYPDQSRGHQYECPSINNTKADKRGKTNVCIKERGCSPFVRPALNKNESEIGGYTSLDEEEKTSEKGDATAKKDKEDELFYADATSGNYTPHVSQTLKENESENGGCSSLIKEEKTSEKGDTTAKKDEEDELFHADATSGDYTPLVNQTLKENESENGGYTSLIKEEKTSEKADTIAKKDKEDELMYVDVIDSHYTQLAKSKPNKSEVPVYQPLLKNGQKELKKPM